MMAGVLDGIRVLDFGRFIAGPFAATILGELATSGESWNLNEVDPVAPENIHIQEVVKVRSGSAEGVGVLEQLVVGPYPRYGFKKFFDAAT